MPGGARATVRVLALLIALGTVPGRADEDEVAALMRELIAYAVEVTGLPPAPTLPRIVPVPPRSLAAVRDAAGAAMPGTRRPELRALYLDGTIWLPKDWRPEDDGDRAVLLHELVHHMQAEAGVHYPCRGAREKPAYAAQRAWLEARGHDALAVMRMNPLFYALITRCLEE